MKTRMKMKISKPSVRPSKIKQLSLAACVAFLSSNAQAALMFDVNTWAGEGFACTDCTFGYEFTLTNPTTFMAMGIFDHGANGLSGAHEVGLWDSSGTLLSSTTISNSSVVVPSAVTTFPSQWLFENITAVNLVAGDYTVGMLQTGSSDALGGDRYVRPGTTTFNLAGSLGGNGLLGFGGGALTRPTSDSGTTALFGPNLSTSSVGAVPIPAAVWLFGSGLLGLVGIARRKTTA